MIWAVFYIFAGHWRNPRLAIMEPLDSAEPRLKTNESVYRCISMPNVVFGIGI